MVGVERTTIVVGVHACDYGLNEKHRQDGRTMEIHSMVRLDAAIIHARGYCADDVDLVFVFSAGCLNSAHRRLCDLQAEYLETLWPQGEYTIVTPPPGENVWGTESELLYLKLCCENYRKFGPVLMLDLTEDYHCRRTRALAKANQIDGLVLLEASSQMFPPTWEERLHEWKSLIARKFLWPRARDFVVYYDRLLRARLRGL